MLRCLFRGRLVLTLYLTCLVVGGVFVGLSAVGAVGKDVEAGHDGDFGDADALLEAHIGHAPEAEHALEAPHDLEAGHALTVADGSHGLVPRKSSARAWMPVFSFRFWTFGSAFFGLTGKEEGEATARGVKHLATAWSAAEGRAREIFMMEKLRTLVGILVGTVNNVKVDQLTVVGDGSSTAAGQVASLLEQLKSAGGVDLPVLVKRLGVGAAAIAPTGAR